MLRYRESSCIYTRILGFRKEHADVLRQIIAKADHTCIVYKSFFRQQRSFPVQAQKRVAYDNINCIHYHMPHVFLIALFSF